MKQAGPRPLEWTPERVRRFWDYLSATSDEYFTDRYGAAIVKTLLPHLRGASSVLDYGCGVGFLVKHLLDGGFSVTAADASPESVATVRRKFDGKPRFGGAFEIDELLRRGDRFDVVFSVEVIEHLDDAALGSLLANLRALCHPEGVVIVTTPNDERLEDSEVFCPSCNCVFHRFQHVRSWSEASLRAVLSENGFDVLETLVTDFRLLDAGSWLKRWRRALRPGKRKKPPHLIAIASLSHR